MELKLLLLLLRLRLCLCGITGIDEPKEWGEGFVFVMKLPWG